MSNPSPEPPAQLRNYAFCTLWQLLCFISMMLFLHDPIESELNAFEFPFPRTG